MSAARAAAVRDAHTRERDAHEALRAAADHVSERLSMVRLTTFVAGAIGISAGVAERSLAWAGAGGAALLAFVVAVVAHARVVARRDRAVIVRDLHAGHLRRMALLLEGFPTGAGLVEDGHVYAGDLDVVGEGSLFSRLDVTHTRRGARTLAAWLAQPAPREVAEARQVAVRELAEQLSLRVALEAAAIEGAGDRATTPARAARDDRTFARASLDDAPFLSFLSLAPAVRGRSGLVALAVALPVTTAAVWLASGWLVPEGCWIPLVIAQAIVVRALEPAVAARHALLVSRARFVESFRAVLEVAEGARFEAPALQGIAARLRASGAPPSVELRRLETWAGLFELRSQGIVHVFVNLFTLWDVHVLGRIEAWSARVGAQVPAWFEALGELEALSSLATLLAQDPDATMPTLVDGAAPFEAEGLVHPLLAPGRRVPNDVALAGAGTALLVTGSNMAGKSTLLRAVGTSIALALAGGPVTARAMRVPHVRLRASMRIADSLQHGASYFQAELARLRTVVEGADEGAPVCFLLDELLRGTNARARHAGARAVLLHLLARRATGLVATHDVALSELEAERAGAVRNVHFTDVFADGEMTFDYRLRPGVVRTSNALRLLRLAGIDVGPDDGLVAEGLDEAAAASTGA